jgi:hypothetical protein
MYSPIPVDGIIFLEIKGLNIFSICVVSLQKQGCKKQLLKVFAKAQRDF